MSGNNRWYFCDKLSELINVYKVIGIVAGDPLYLSGKQSHISKKFELYMNDIKYTFTDLLIYTIDERLTTKHATNILNRNGLNVLKLNKGVVDRISACLILEYFLLSKHKL